MSEDYDYRPASWSADTSFASARAAYRSKVVDRSYSKARAGAVTEADILPEELVTNCSGPVLVISDQTGSMGEWPTVIRGKLGYLDHEMRTEYRGEDVETAFLAIGDAHNHETYPLQARPFSSGENMVKELEKLIFEGKGGGGMHETYELAALYLARKFKAPKAIKKPVVIFIGDEKCYPSISPDMARQHCRVELERVVTTEEVFRELQVFCSVYVVLKPYRVESFNTRDATNEDVYKSWVDLVGADHIAPLSAPEDVTNVIFGILAKEANKIDYFRAEIEDRQKDVPDRVKTVYTALETIYANPSSAPIAVLTKEDAGKSRIVRGVLPAGTTKKTKRLI